MTHATLLPDGTGVELPAGGLISVVGDDGAIAPGRLGIMDDGVAFGPVALALASDGIGDGADGDDDEPVLSLTDLRWTPADGVGMDAWLFGVGVTGVTALGAATDDDEDIEQHNPRLSRRATLSAAASLIALSAVSSTARANEDGDEDADDDLVIARATVERADVPYWVGVLDVVDRALPFSSDIGILVDGARVESVTDPGYDHAGNGYSLAAGTTGEVEVRLKDAVRYRDRAVAWMRGLLYSDEEIELSYKLPDDASELEPGETIDITQNRAVVAAAADTEGSGTVVQLGAHGIPHATNRWGVDRGTFAVERHRRGGTETLVYEVGKDSPSHDELTIRFHAGRIASTLDRLERGNLR